MAHHDNYAHVQFVLKDLEERVYNLKTYDRSFEINGFCDDLISEVSVTVESAIQHLNQVEHDLISQINKYRSELIDTPLPALESESIKRQLEDFSKEVDHLTKKCLAQLNQQPNSTPIDDLIDKTEQEIKIFIERSKEIERSVKSHVFLNKFMKFRKNHVFFIENDQIGRLDTVDEEDLRRKYNEKSLVFAKNPFANSCNEGGVFDNYCLHKPMFLSTGYLAFIDGFSTFVWNLEEDKMIFEFHGTCGNYSLTELRNGYLVIGTENGEIILYDIDQARQVSSTKAHRSFVVTMMVLRNGNLASLCDIDDIKIWKVTSKGQLDLQLKISNHGCWYNQLSELSNGFIVGYSLEEETAVATIKIWNPKNGRLIRTIPTFVKSFKYCVLSNDQIAVANADAKNILIYNPNEDFPCQVIGNMLSNTLLYQFSNGLLIADDYDKETKSTSLIIYNPENGQQLCSFPKKARLKCISVDFRLFLG